MRGIGLPGKAFLPLIVGFGCNVPAISATRILPDARHRVMTALLVPFTSCSARLTVYLLVAGMFFPRSAGTVVFGMYVASILFVVLIGLLLRRTLWRTVGQEPLVLDLPAYQRPTLRLIGSSTWVRVRGFLHTASGIIVATVTLVWLLQAIPVHGGTFGSVAPDDSLFAAAARAIAPVFSPAGFGEWHTVGALVVGFVAKEAVLTSWAQTYAAADPTAGLAPDQLQAHVHMAFALSAGGAVTGAVFAFLLFLLAYTPCVATMAAQRREIGMTWTMFGIALQITVAWTVAVAVFQIGRLLTHRGLPGRRMRQLRLGRRGCARVRRGRAVGAPVGAGPGVALGPPSHRLTGRRLSRRGIPSAARRRSAGSWPTPRSPRRRRP
jgi:ferrous iron transport protein B